MSPTLRESPGDEAAEAFRVRTKGLVRAPPMAAALEALRNSRRDEPIADSVFDFSIGMLIPLSEIQIKGGNWQEL